MTAPRRGLLLFLSALAMARTGMAQQAAAGIDACALLQPQEIAQILGRSTSEGVRSDAGLESNGAWSSSCIWVLDAPRAAPAQPLQLRGRSFVILNAMRWPAGSSQARSFLESFHEAKAAGVLAAPLVPKKVGDEALWWGDGLAVVRRNISFGISVRLVSERKAVPGTYEEELAKHVLRRVDARDVQDNRTLK